MNVLLRKIEYCSTVRPSAKTCEINAICQEIEKSHLKSVNNYRFALAVLFRETERDLRDFHENMY